MKGWQWFKSFTKNNQKLVTGLAAVILISLGAPVYMAQPVATGVINQMVEEPGGSV